MVAVFLTLKRKRKILYVIENIIQYIVIVSKNGATSATVCPWLLGRGLFFCLFSVISSMLQRNLNIKGGEAMGLYV